MGRFRAQGLENKIMIAHRLKYAVRGPQIYFRDLRHTGNICPRGRVGLVAVRRREAFMTG
jgi:hypothetical protein